MKILLQNPPKRTKKKSRRKARRKARSVHSAPPRRRRRRIRSNPPRTTTVKKRRRSTGRRRSRAGFIDKDLAMQIAGVTVGAIVPPLIVGKFLPKAAESPTTAALANIGAGVALAAVADRIGQRNMAKAIVVGAGASGLSAFVTNALAKPSGSLKGFLEAPEAEQIQPDLQFAA